MSFFSLLEEAQNQNPVQNRGRLWLISSRGDTGHFTKKLLRFVLQKNGYAVQLILNATPEILSEALLETCPDVLLMSGLLQSFVKDMVGILQHLEKTGLQFPLMIGGGGLSERTIRETFVKRYSGPIFYTKNLAQSLVILPDLLGLCPPDGLTALETPPKHATIEASPSHSSVSPLSSIPIPPDTQRHCKTDFDLPTLWSGINPRTLYQLHLGYPGPFTADLKKGAPEAVLLHSRVEAVKTQILLGSISLVPKAVWQFFPCQSHDDMLLVKGVSFPFPRQKTPPHLCLADYIHPTQKDFLGLLVVTAGYEVEQILSEWLAQNRAIDAYILFCLSLQTAEATAEFVHQHVRHWLGLPEAETPEALWQANYHGKRFSFGYSACPDLSLQKPLFDLLHPDDIGITLSSSMAMDPEWSVSALIFHHPEARYFSC